jgi:hypothetical protein
MSTAEPAARGWQVVDAAGRRIGTVDAVFADYLLVRTSGWLPVDLYVPVTAVRNADEPKSVIVEAADDREAYERWHRPLKKAPHD